MEPKHKMIRGIRSIEHFNHFRCGSCSKWWGIGDAPEKRKEWFCPWCGKKSLYKKGK
jgi:DNA-directed RNA polymerase subunit RPC12/RpoP